MTNILFYGAYTKQQSDEQLTIEYHFTVAAMPIAVVISVQREGNDKTYPQLLEEAVGYARVHYTMIKESRGN